MTATLPAPPLTWEVLVRLEPRLGLLLRRIQTLAGRVPPGGVAVLWEGPRGGWGIHQQLEQLVGWYRRCGPPALRTSTAYDVAGDVLAAALCDALSTPPRGRERAGAGRPRAAGARCGSPGRPRGQREDEEPRVGHVAAAAVHCASVSSAEVGPSTAPGAPSRAFLGVTSVHEGAHDDRR
jgi:hypothetical protein